MGSYAKTRRIGIRHVGTVCLTAALFFAAPNLGAQTRDAKPPSGGSGVIIPIHTEITDVTAESVRRRIEQARSDGASTVIFELNTPGGLVSSTFDIADQIRNLTDMRSIAWVNTTAHSGGAIVAIACEEIVTARSSRIGDAQVIFGNPIGAEAIPEDLKPKMTTPVLGDVRASAQLRGYSKVLCESFVVPEREVWWLENIETGKREFVFRAEKMKRLGESETKKTTDAATEDEEGEEKPATKKSDPAPKKTKASPEWKRVEKYFDIVLETEIDLVQPVVRDDQLLQMSASEAHAYGFSKGLVTDDNALRDRYGLSGVSRLAPTWSETLALWMTSMWVRGFLLVIILLGAYVEFHTPGVGVPGLVALISLAIFVVAPYLTGLANVWEILFIFLGFSLIALEMFVIPGFGVDGVSGICMVIVGLLATFVPDEPGRSIPLYIPTLPSTLHGLRIAVITIVSSMFASLIGMVMLSRYLPKMPMFRHMLPENPTPSEVAVGDPYHGLARVGDAGKTVGPLHPAGKARFGSETVDVVTQGEFLEVDTEIEVIERRGNRVVVRAVG